MKYMKRPVVVEAIQFTGDNFAEVVAFFGEFRGFSTNAINTQVHMDAREGRMQANKNDWIIKGLNGEFYPCDPDTFATTYDPVAEFPK